MFRKHNYHVTLLEPRQHHIYMPWNGNVSFEQMGDSNAKTEIKSHLLAPRSKIETIYEPFA
jgi:hypothetical protein